MAFELFDLLAPSILGGQSIFIVPTNAFLWIVNTNLNHDRLTRLYISRWRRLAHPSLETSMNVCAAASMLRIPSLRVKQLHPYPHILSQNVSNAQQTKGWVLANGKYCFPGVLVLVIPVKAISKDAQTSSGQAAELLSLQGISSTNNY